MLAISRQPMIISDAGLAKLRLPSRAHPMFWQRAREQDCGRNVYLSRIASTDGGSHWAEVGDTILPNVSDLFDIL